MPERYKQALLPVPKSSLEREERLATVWQAFISDAVFSINSYWGQSMALEEMHCNLPTSSDEYRKKVRNTWSTKALLTAHQSDDMMENPQSLRDPDFYT
jgi:hypothetical protein